MKSRSQLSIGIAGAGILGRLFALRLESLGWNVSLFDQSTGETSKTSSYVAAGMLAPYCEMDSSEKLIFDLGVDSIEMWPTLLREHNLPVFFQKEGSLVVAHPMDRQELNRLRQVVFQKLGKQAHFREVTQSDLSILEPELDPRFLNGTYFPYEGQIDARHLMRALKETLEFKKVRYFWNESLHRVQPNQIDTSQNQYHFDLVLDCRGIGAKDTFNGLRAIRGELIHILAPSVHLKRPIRLIHPRYPLYVVPRPGGNYLIGATHIENDDSGPITVRSALELLTAAFSLHSGFSEARILEAVVGLRPAFTSHLPRVRYQEGLIQINGLYRHGFLISPKLTELVCEFIMTKKMSKMTSSIFEEAA